MEVGDKRFIYIDDVYFTDGMIFLDIWSPLYIKEEVEEEMDLVIMISKIGKGLKEDDFLLEIPEGTIIEGSPKSLQHVFLLEKENFVIFTDYETIDDEIETEEEENEENLEEQLRNAEIEEDWDKAIILRDKLNK